jgi:hypothetical protein
LQSHIFSLTPGVLPGVNAARCGALLLFMRIHSAPSKESAMKLIHGVLGAVIAAVLVVPALAQTGGAPKAGAAKEAVKADREKLKADREQLRKDREAVKADREKLKADRAKLKEHRQEMHKDRMQQHKDAKAARGAEKAK